MVNTDGKDMTPVKTPMYDNNLPVLGLRAGKRDNENTIDGWFFNTTILVHVTSDRKAHQYLLEKRWLI